MNHPNTCQTPFGPTLKMVELIQTWSLHLAKPGSFEPSCDDVLGSWVLRSFGEDFYSAISWSSFELIFSFFRPFLLLYKQIWRCMKHTREAEWPTCASCSAVRSKPCRKCKKSGKGSQLLSDRSNGFEGSPSALSLHLAVPLLQLFPLGTSTSRKCPKWLAAMVISKPSWQTLRWHHPSRTIRSLHSRKLPLRPTPVTLAVTPNRAGHSIPLPQSAPGNDASRQPKDKSRAADARHFCKTSVRMFNV